MKAFILIFLTIFLAGCASQIEIEDYHLIEEYNQTQGNMTHSFQFALNNPTSKNAECKAVLNIGEEQKTYKIGDIEPRSRKKVIIPFQMPDGETNLSLVPECTFE